METVPVLITLIAAGIIAWTCTSAEIPVVRGALLSTGASENRLFKILLPLIAIAALTIPAWKPVPIQKGFYLLLGDRTEQQLLETALATIVAVVLCTRISPVTSPVLAATGAVFGNLAVSGGVPADTALSSALVWMAAPVVAMLLSLIIFSAVDGVIRRRHIHLLKLDRAMRAALGVSAVLFIAGAFYNISPVIGAFTSKVAGSGIVSAGICLLCAGTGYLILFNRIRRRSWEFADLDFDISSPALLATILSSAAVLAIAPVPLSAGFLVLSAMAGVSITGKEVILEWKESARTALSAVATLAISFLLGYGFNFGDNPASIIVLITLLLCLLGVTVFLRSQNEKELQRNLILSREQQIESNRRSLTALEVRSEMAENDLADKLDGKRKQLVDFALGISGQKEYMEGLYSRLQEVRAIEDPHDKNKELDTLLGTLRERMYFTREMNDFYAQSEIVNKDFNLRLNERFPSLTENERKLANLLRQGFSSKYIASLMNITPKSVEINRYRLRAKLGLKRNDNLITFIKTI